MQPIKIEYPHPFFPWKQTAKTGSFPESMEEITRLQFIAVLNYSAMEINETTLLKTMTGISRRAIKKLGDFQRYKLIELLSFVAETKGFNRFLVPVLKTHKGKLYSPKPRLKGLTFEQFIFADAWFSDYAETKEPESLAKFVAALYIPKNKPFTESMIDDHFPAIQKLNAALLNSVFVNFGFLRDWLSDAYPLVFSKSDEQGQKKKTQHATAQSNGWIKIFETIVGDDIIHSDKYAQTPIHNILRFLTERIKQNQKRR